MSGSLRARGGAAPDGTSCTGPQLFSGLQASGVPQQNFVTTLFTIVAIAVGCLIGSWIYNAFWEPIFRSAGTMAEMMKSHLRWKR